MCAHIYFEKTERILAHRIKEHNSKNKSIELAYQSHKKENQTHIIDASVIEIINNVKRDVTYQQTETDVEKFNEVVRTLLQHSYLVKHK
jgi:hypothetical protein